MRRSALSWSSCVQLQTVSLQLPAPRERRRRPLEARSQGSTLTTPRIASLRKPSLHMRRASGPFASEFLFKDPGIVRMLNF
jgi:hypothetical protein